MMVKNFFYATFLVLFLTQCNNFKGAKSKKEKADDIEGELIFSRQMFGNRILSQNDSLAYNTTRTMYIYKNCLIDVRETLEIKDGIFIGKGTTSYNFYNFDKQKYVEFKHLTGDLGIFKEGPMTEIKEFSQDKKYDPLYGVPDSAFVIKDTML